MDWILSQLQSLHFDDIFIQITGRGEPVIRINEVAAVVVLIVALLNCFLGLKLLRVWSALCGLGSGFLIGSAGGFALTGAGTASLIIGGVLGAALAVLLAWWRRGGVFVVSFLLGTGIMVLILNPDNLIKLVICLAVGVVMGIMAEILTAPVVILLTGLQGGMAAGAAVVALEILPWPYTIYLVGIVFTVLGIAVQFALESGRKVRINIANANKIRQAESTENEVDRARYIIDHLDELEDDGRRIKYEEDDDEDIEYPMEEERDYDRDNEEDDDIRFLDL